MTAYETLQDAMARLRAHGTEPEVIQCEAVFFKRLLEELGTERLVPHDEQPDRYTFDGNLTLIVTPHPEIPPEIDSADAPAIQTPAGNK